MAPYQGTGPVLAGRSAGALWRAPLPADGAPDLVYARLLLAHLPDAAQLASSWAGQLGPGGDPWVAEQFGADTVSRLDRELSLITAGEARCEITWWLRQMVIQH